MNKLSSSIIFIILGMILLVTLLFEVGCESPKEAKEATEREALTMLDDSAYWFIKKGLANYYQDKDFNKILKYIKDREVYFIHEGLISIEDSFLAQIALQYLWVGSDVTCFVRKETQNKIYEYWVIANESKRPDFKCRIRFIVAMAEGMTKERTIIYESNDFFAEFVLPDGTKLEFPTNNLRAIYALGPWDYPSEFKGTELEDLKEKNVYKKM